MDPDQILPLRRAGIYQFPSDQQAILPRVFGDLTDPLALEPDPGTDPTRGDGGFTPAVCISTEELVYCINDGRSVATEPQVYWNGILQEPGSAIWNPAHDFEGQGLISTLTFSLNVVTTGEVAVRFGGSVDGTGQPITNPILGLYTMLTQYAGLTMADFDRGTCERTRHDMDAMGYPFYACFAEELTIGEWLADILPEYHTDFTQNAQGQLSIILDRSLTTLPVHVDYHIPAHEVEDGGSPITAIRPAALAENVINQPVIHGRHNWVAGGPTLSYVWDYRQNQAAYHAAYPMDYTRKHMYTLAHASQWLNSHAMRHGFEPKTFTLTLNTLRGLVLIPPRFVTLEWPLYGWVEHLLKVTKIAISFRTRSVTLTCLDIGRERTDPVTSPLASPTQRRQQLSRAYTFLPDTVGSEGSLPDAPRNPRNEAANGDLELGDNGQWDLYTANAAPQWEFILNAAEAHQGRSYLRSIPNAGNGTAFTLRTRIDPGEYVLASAWFTRHSVATNGSAQSVLFFFDQDDVFLPALVLRGNPIDPNNAYFESVAFGQAPAQAYYYRPGITLPAYPTAGQWRADNLFAISGTQTEVLNARHGDTLNRNPIINGDFEAGPLLFDLGRRWIITNNPGVSARSGLWYAAHIAEPGAFGEDRLSSLTRISVAEGQPFRFQGFMRTVNNPSGTMRIGVTWVDGQGNGIGEIATTLVPGPFAAYTITAGATTVPANAVYAHPWVGVTNHFGGSGVDFWIFEDLFQY